MKKTLFLFFAFSCILLNLNSQKLVGTNLAEIQSDSNFSKINIPELNVFIQTAEKSSPLLQATDKEIDQILEKIKIEKKSWINYVYIDGNGRYGLFDQITITDQISGSTTPLGVKLANQQFNYYLGLSVRLPIGNLTSKKNEINILNYSIKANELKKQQLLKELTQLVIEEYYKLISYKETMDVAQDIVQTFEISYMKALKDFKSGMLNLTDFATLVSARGNAKQSLIKSRNEFYSQFYKLQVITGLKLNKY